MIYLNPPHQTGKELEYVKEALQSNYIAPVGPFLERFENSVKEYTKAPHALALNSATAGLHLALRVLGVKERDKVGVSNFTFIASVSPILYQKATPIFIDCDDSWQMDLNLLEEALKKERLKAVIITHIYGGCCDIKEAKSLCQKYGAHLIEDSAESLGTLFENRHTGTYADFGVYSFNGNKILTTGGGGVLVGNDGELMREAKKLSTQAKEEGYEWYEHHTYGYNYRLSNILAAIGTAQMEVIEERVKKKREIFGWYNQFLEAGFMPQIEGCRSNRWLTAAIFEKNPLDIHKKLKRHSIESRPLWKPMDMQPAFKGAKCYSQGVGEKLFEKGLCLPSGTQLEKEDVEYICSLI